MNQWIGVVANVHRIRQDTFFSAVNFTLQVCGFLHQILKNFKQPDSGWEVEVENLGMVLGHGR